MKITRLPPAPPAPQYNIECTADELRYLRQVTGDAYNPSAENRAGVPSGTGMRVFLTLKDAESALL